MRLAGRRTHINYHRHAGSLLSMLLHRPPHPSINSRLRSALATVIAAVVIISFSRLSRRSGSTAAVAAQLFDNNYPMIAFSSSRSISSSTAAISSVRDLLSASAAVRGAPLPSRKQSFSMEMMSASSQPSPSSSLTQQLAARLIHGRNNNCEILFPMKLCIAIAGGGSNASSAIASTPGASSILLESIVTYSRRSFAEFVTSNYADFNDNDEYEHDERYSDNGNDCNNNRSPSSTLFSFSSKKASILLSQAALSKCILLSPKFQDRALYCVGVGCASVLVGRGDDGGDDGAKGRSRCSKAYIALSTLRRGKSTIIWEVTLDNNSPMRSRLQEETIISNIVLALLIQYRETQQRQQQKQMMTKEEKDDEKYGESIIKQILDKEGDELKNTRVYSYEGSSFGLGKNNNGNGNDDSINKLSLSWSPAVGACQIIQGNAEIALVLPVQRIDEDEMACHIMETVFISDKRIPFPRDIIIIPGSYNPPHHGHVGLANAAVMALRRRRRNEEKEYYDNNSSSFEAAIRSRYSSLESFSSDSSSSTSLLKNLWDSVDKHFEKENDPTVLFEMSVTNADKPPLDPVEVERRINLFPTLSDMPKDWGVMLTNAPLFLQKTSLLEVVLTESCPFSSRKMTFVLGTDTMVRIIDPKYYDNSFDKMIAALVEMKEKGVHFIVGGRLEQADGGSKKFINGKEEVKSLPSNVQEMFTLLTEEEFRLDVSSTEIRKKQGG